MQTKIRFTLDTDYKRFELWLRDYWIRTTPLTIELPDNTRFEVPRVDTFRLVHGGIRNHNIDGSFIRTKDGSDELVQAITAINIDLFEPSENRLHVSVDCLHDLMLPYFEKMLLTIAAVWPEAKEPINSGLAGIMPDPDYSGKDKKGKSTVSNANRNERESARRSDDHKALDRSTDVVSEAAESESKLNEKHTSKRGPKSYSDQEKIQALNEWDRIDRKVRLEEFLERKFGTEGGLNKVSNSTFHGWRRRLRKLGLIE